MCNKQQTATITSYLSIFNGKWKVFCAVLALVYGNCAFGMFSFGNNGTFGGQKTTQTENNYKKSNEKVETQISELQRSLNEIKQIIENNQQELIEIITDLKKQIEKPSKIIPDEQAKETEETKPNITFGGQNPYKSIRNPLKVRSDGQVQETEETKPKVTFGGRNPYTSTKEKGAK